MRGVFTGYVKQLNPALGDEHFHRVFTQCFPEFENQIGVHSNLGVDNVITSTGWYEVQEGRRRRFAGGPDLPVSRYHSVCADASGDDDGTMCFELMTYWSARLSGQVFPSMFDTSSHPGAERFVESLRSFVAKSPDKRYRLAAERLLESGRPLLSVIPMRAHASVQETQNAQEFLDFPALCELRIREITVPDCLDLRLESHREYFCTELARTEPINAREQFAGTRHATTVDFMSVLSAVIFPELGGDVFHAAVGQVLRKRGYQGLVFPSARNDSSVVNVDGALVEHSGWNFVDYRGAPKIPKRAVRWALPIGRVLNRQSLADLGVETYLVDKHPSGGVEYDATGYVTDGVAAQEWRRIEHELTELAAGRTTGLFYDRFSLRPLREYPPHEPPTDLESG